MKNFNTLQELWDCCLYCPVCQRNCRQLHLSVGPDDTFILVDFDKTGPFLHVQCTFKKKSRTQSIRYDIDCKNNIIHTNAPDFSNFFFFLEGICNECSCSSVHSLDLKLDFINKSISNIGLELENFCLLKATDKYRINIWHGEDPQTMLISKIITTANDPNAEMEWVEDHNSIRLPLIKLDFSDQVKLSNKIKTLILFS